MAVESEHNNTFSFLPKPMKRLILRVSFQILKNVTKIAIAEYQNWKKTLLICKDWVKTRAVEKIG